jgi:TrkA domain protein
MAEVRETRLPGVGVRHELVTSSGQRVVVLHHRTGRRDLGVFLDPNDPDACTTVAHLDEEDARTLAELLGGVPLTEAAAGVQRIAGVAIDWIPIGEGSAVTGTTIGQGRLRTRTGASVVAIVRRDATVPAPGPDEVLQAGDVVVAVGTVEGLRQLRALLEA